MPQTRVRASESGPGPCIVPFSVLLHSGQVGILERNTVVERSGLDTRHEGVLFGKKGPACTIEKSLLEKLVYGESEKLNLPHDGPMLFANWLNFLHYSLSFQA